jgi:hypothetical protein
MDFGATVNKEGSEDAKLGDFMHYKFYIIDDKLAKSGSYNWSINAGTNRETLDEVSVDKKLSEFNECLKNSVNFFEDNTNPAQKKAELALIEKENKEALTPEILAAYHQAQAAIIKQKLEERHKRELEERRRRELEEKENQRRKAEIKAQQENVKNNEMSQNITVIAGRPNFRPAIISSGDTTWENGKKGYSGSVIADESKAGANDRFLLVMRRRLEGEESLTKLINEQDIVKEAETMIEAVEKGDDASEKKFASFFGAYYVRYEAFAPEGHVFAAVSISDREEQTSSRKTETVTDAKGKKTEKPVVISPAQSKGKYFRDMDGKVIIKPSIVRLAPINSADLDLCAEFDDGTPDFRNCKPAKDLDIEAICRAHCLSILNDKYSYYRCITEEQLKEANEDSSL